MNEHAGEYEGMDRFECRNALVEELKLKEVYRNGQSPTNILSDIAIGAIPLSNRIFLTSGL